MKKNIMEIAEAIEGLGREEREALYAICFQETVPAEGRNALKEYLINTKYSEKRVCPKCGGTHVVKNGTRPDGVQKFLCRNCKKSFSPTTNTIFSGTHGTIEQWMKFIDGTFACKSLKQLGAELGVHYNTMHNWRMKLFAAVKMILEEKGFSGEIQMDEFYQAVSYKGNHMQNRDFQMPRKAHKRGSDDLKRGLSTDQVCVPCAVDDNGSCFGKAVKVGAVSSEALKNLFSLKISENSKIITDESLSYVKLAETVKADLVQIPSGTHQLDGHNIQTINSFHTSVKNLINHNYRGVSTKYLDYYVAWAAFQFKLEMQHRISCVLSALNRLFSIPVSLIHNAPVLPGIVG